MQSIENRESFPTWKSLVINSIKEQINEDQYWMVNKFCVS